MRFHIACFSPLEGKSYLEEVIGDLVEIEGMPENSCAVHALVNKGPEEPFYAVSHIESGHRVAGGDSIDLAILQARETVAWMLATHPTKEIHSSTARAVEKRRQLDVRPIIPQPQPSARR
ncbi:hypothetical protein [Cupriavidus sp. YAF13]|uniref:hypothetical protein n=1 Tax=Cupriavidus sp. YAF13 TaxID=3233075 RepID=UPI003F9364C1